MNLDWYIPDSDERRRRLPVVVFDGDDTLWATESLYDAARRSSAGVVARAGLDPVRFERAQRDIDVVNFSRYGLSRFRFPTSSKEAYLALVREAGRTASDATAQEVFDASAAVFDAPAPLTEYAQTTLLHLRGRFRLLVLTKGDPVVQRKRVGDSGLAPLLDGVCIVEVKDTPVFSAVLDEVDAEPASAWSVGNSYGSDVHPAVVAGMRAIWIDAEVWAHERSLSDGLTVEHDEHVFVADGLHEVPAIIEGSPPRRLPA